MRLRHAESLLLQTDHDENNDDDDEGNDKHGDYGED